METNKAIDRYAGQLRADAFRIISKHAGNTLGGVVETGCIRTWPHSPDGASTIILSALAAEHGREFASLEINPDHTRKASDALQELGLTAQFVVNDSIVSLRALNNIGILYLDSFDYEQANPRQCQRHAMGELGAAWGGLSPRCIVAFDDWNYTDGGKGGIAIPFLLENGFTTIYEGYVRVYGRGI